MSSKIKNPPQNIQEAVIQFIEERYSVRNAKIDQSINDNIEWRPSCYWKTETGFIACEISEDKPFRPILPIAFQQILTNRLLIRMITAFPTTSEKNKEYKTEINKIKAMGIGLISIDIDNGFAPDLIYAGVAIPLIIGKLDYAKFHKSIKTQIQDAYEIYINNSPQNGVQNIGQLIERAVINLATQAKANGKLITGGFNPDKNHYPQANLIDDLMRDRVIDNGILGRCRGFCDYRNNVSHKPKNQKEAAIIEGQLREWFENGLAILKELPEEFRKKGFKFKQ